MDSEGKQGLVSSSETGADAASMFSATPDAARRQGADPYDAILWRLRSCEANPGDGFTVGVLGCGRRCGATTIAANTAIRFADHGLGPVLLIECNFYNSVLARLFRLRTRTGLSDVLTGEADLSECIHATRVRGLELMPLGSSRSIGSAGLTDRIGPLLAELRNEYATILIDLPPAERIAAALPLARSVDAALMIVRCESTLRRVSQGILKTLLHDGVPVIGSVVTRRKSSPPRWLGGV